MHNVKAGSICGAVVHEYKAFVEFILIGVYGSNIKGSSYSNKQSEL